MRKFPFLTVFEKINGAWTKKNTCRYWTISVFVFFLVIIAWDICLNVLGIGMSHNPYVLFL